jgi:hypothetical protein
VKKPEQNLNLKRAWVAAGHPNIYGPGMPFHDPAALPNKRKVILSDTAGKRISLPMALRGVCYSNCTGKHGTLSDGEVRRVVEAGGLALDF